MAIFIIKRKGIDVSKKTKLLALSVVAGASLLALQANAAELTNASQKLSYTIGYEMGQNFKKQDVQIDNKTLVQGLQDGLTGNKPLMSKEQRQATIVSFQKKMIAKQETKLKSSAAKNLKEGKAFLANNAKKSGIKTLADGLQYKIITEGAGPKPSLTDTVTVNYIGEFSDGKVFDSSYKRGKPTTFALNQVIKGWQEALTMMPTGSTWEVYVPAKLAYGERGMGPIIGPNKALKFKIELISIKKKS